MAAAVRQLDTINPFRTAWPVNPTTSRSNGTGSDGNIDFLWIPFTRAATGRVIGQRPGANDSREMDEAVVNLPGRGMAVGSQPADTASTMPHRRRKSLRCAIIQSVRICRGAALSDGSRSNHSRSHHNIRGSLQAP